VNEPAIRLPLLVGVEPLGILPLRLSEDPACAALFGCSSRKRSEDGHELWLTDGRSGRHTDGGEMVFRIDEAVFEKFPGLTIGVVVATGIDNRRSREQAAAFLEAQIDDVGRAWSIERLDTDPRIAAWRDAYRAFGAKPKKHRSSIENMIRMILDGVPFDSINTAVDVYNAISLEHCVPIGGDDLDRVAGDIRLTFATGDEWFVPLNGTTPVSPKPREVVYRDDEDVLCRRWNWRECDKSKMTEESVNLCLVVEALPPVSASELDRIPLELAEEIERFCGGSTFVDRADRDTPAVELWSP
jgi:DNA/RNA-binding domain of Phe-tRNA-synthetase-like protein